MLKQIIAIIIAVFLVVFGSNRINQSKSTLTSNYLVLNSIQKQNLEELLNTVEFNIPSFSFDGDMLGLKPYVNTDGKVEVYVGKAIVGSIINPDLEGVDCFNNNYLFTYSISFNNRTKRLNIEDQTSIYGAIESKEVTKDSETLLLLQMQ
jgi:uncharacterized protein YxeA